MAEAPRKLAAIVSVDIAGFSALAERDAAEALAHVARVRTYATGIAAKHNGRIFNTAGDGLMLEFATANDALNAAIELCETTTSTSPRACKRKPRPARSLSRTSFTETPRPRSPPSCNRAARSSSRRCAR
jgi:class 3 adenylate cyclase